MESEFVPRPGALRYQDYNGEWLCCNPRDSLYSTVTMFATEMWQTELGWVNIYDEEPDAG